MENRFYEIGKDQANEIRMMNNLENTGSDDLDLFMAECSWDWFIAECSDDYSRTLSEQADIQKRIKNRLGNNIKLPARWRC